MHRVESNTAILFFARSAKAEADHKRFTRDGRHKDIQIADSFIEHVQHQISDANLPCFRFDETKQVGDSFGERITNAFRSVFNKGYDHVIAVGNDTPLLETRHISDAVQRLESSTTDIVLGPDKDGGTWLMGYSKTAFESTHFQQLPWKTPHLLQAILQYSAGSKNIDLLETLSDIDDADALRAFSQTSHLDISILQLIQRIGSILSAVVKPVMNKPTSIGPVFFFRNNLLRAPPTS